MYLKQWGGSSILSFPFSFFFSSKLILFLHTSELHICGLVQVSVAYRRTWLTYKARVYSSSDYLSWQGLDLSCEFCCWWITFASVECVHLNALRVKFWSGVCGVVSFSLFFHRTQFCRAFKWVLPSLIQNLTEVNKSLNMCSQLILCFKTLLTRYAFMPIMKRFAELVLVFCFLCFLSGKLLLQQHMCMCKRQATRQSCHCISREGYAWKVVW